MPFCRRVKINNQLFSLFLIKIIHRTKELFDKLASHIPLDEDVWSMADFVAVRSGTFVQGINALIAKCEMHVFSCEVCVFLANIIILYFNFFFYLKKLALHWPWFYL